MSRGRGIGNDDGGGGSQQHEHYLAIGGGEGQIEEQQGRVADGPTDNRNGKEGLEQSNLSGNGNKQAS